MALKSAQQFNSMLPELPEIKIVRHARAKHLRLRVERQSIRLTVPLRASKTQIQHFLQQSQEWIWQSWQKQQPQSIELPTQLRLFNLSSPVAVEYRAQPQKYHFDEQQNLLSVRQEQAAQALNFFVLDYAKHHLPVYLQHVSRHTQLPYSDCTIRRPKTRWGSCTTQHKIMLHAALVLMDVAIVHYVCVHELAHTRHFDHSPNFWSQVQQHAPNFMQQRQALKAYQLPSWWFAV